MLHSVAKKATFSATDFLIGRAVRILPLYWIASTLFIVVVAINHIHKFGLNVTLTEPLFSGNFILSSYFLIPAFNPESHFLQPFLAQGWTLSYEFYFYILLMLAGVGAKTNPAKTALFSSLLLCLGLVAGAPTTTLNIFLKNPIVIEFVFGMLVFLLTQKTKKHGIVAIGLGFAILAGTAFIKVDNRLAFWGVPSALILYGFVALEGKIPVPALLKALGNASYSLYLSHGVLTYLYGGFVKRGWWHSPTQQNFAVMLGTAGALLLGLLSYKFIEKPLIGWFSRYRSRTALITTAQQVSAHTDQADQIMASTSVSRENSATGR